MKLLGTVGLSVAASLLATTVAALDQRSRSDRPKTRVRQTELRMRRPVLPPHKRLAHG